jgi:hypothetical protein
MAAAFDFRGLVTELGREFKRRGMERHLWALRRFYREYLLHETEPRLWSFDLVIEWLCLLRIGPFDHVYKVLPRGAPCPRCGSAEARGAPAVWTEAVWSGGAKLHCTRCGAAWLQLDAQAPRK